MIAALVDNGSLEPAAHLNLRRLAAALTARTGVDVRAVSWKHSDRIDASLLEDEAAWTLHPWIRTQVAHGRTEFILVPFFISAQGAIGSWLRRDLETLEAELGFRFAFTPGLAAQGVLTRIVTARIREVITARRLERPAVVVVDHGGPSPASAQLRNEIAAAVRTQLKHEVRDLTAASMEGHGHAHSRPLFDEALRAPAFTTGDVVIAPLFLAPGRHAGPAGDLMQLAAAARNAAPGRVNHHFADLVGTHPDVAPALADALTRTLATFHAAA